MHEPHHNLFEWTVYTIMEIITSHYQADIVSVPVSLTVSFPGLEVPRMFYSFYFYGFGYTGGARVVCAWSRQGCLSLRSGVTPRRVVLTSDLSLTSRSTTPQPGWWPIRKWSPHILMEERGSPLYLMVKIILLVITAEYDQQINSNVVAV